MLSRIRIKNFRCLRDVSLDLAPLTFIVGPNGSGKSSILLALQLLKQSIDKGITFDGEFVELGSFQDVLYSGPGVSDVLFGDRSWVSLQVYVKLSKTELDIISPLLNNPLIPSEVSRPEEVGYEASFNGTQIMQSYLVNNQKIFTFGLVEVGTKSYGWKIQLPPRLKNVDCSGADRILGPDAISINYGGTGIPNEDIKSFLHILRLISTIIRKQIESTYYISVLRQPTMMVTGPGYFPRWVGRKGEHTVGLLALIFGSREYELARERIIEWARAFGLDELRAGWRGRQELSADFKDPKTHTTQKITAAGYGSVQILPIITQLFWSPVNSTISFEEPEISLHLELLSKLPTMFSEVVNEGKQLIITTHEQNILFALKPVIAKKELSHEKVALYELQRSEEGSTVQKLEVTPEGAIKGGISSFIEAQRNMIYQWTLTVRPANEGKHSDA